MFVLQKRLTTFLCSYSRIHIAAECRYISDYKAFEGSKYMQKLINKKGGKKTKKKWYQSHVADPMEIFSIKEPKNKHGVSQSESIRARQLGHVLYDKITQIINTGELSEEILSKQVFVTSVKMLPNFEGVHVYWDSGRSDAAEVESLLRDNAGKLRSILISYHVLGRIPVITFVKDQSHADLAHLNQLFEVADYGPDYVPSSPNDILRNQLLTKWGRSLEVQSSDSFTANMNNLTDSGFNRSEATPIHEAEDSAVSDVVNNDNQSSDPATSQSSQMDTQSVDVMRGLKFLSNVYSLPHDDLMKKVLAHTTKGKCPSDEVTSNKTEATSDFDINLLKSRNDKMRLKYVADSSRFKQRLLERDSVDFMSEAEN